METANAEKMPAHEFAKVVVYFCETGFGMTVVPADRLVDLTEIGYLLGVSWIRFARENEMPELFPDCEVGAMPPFGDVFRMPVLVDAEVAKNKFITFNIGSHTDAVRMSFEDYRALVNPLIGSLTIREAALAACK
jgi:Ala-tRNA(Pro) deacylase